MASTLALDANDEAPPQDICEEGSHDRSSERAKCERDGGGEGVHLMPIERREDDGLSFRDGAFVDALAYTQSGRDAERSDGVRGVAGAGSGGCGGGGRLAEAMRTWVGGEGEGAAAARSGDWAGGISPAGNPSGNKREISSGARLPTQLSNGSCSRASLVYGARTNSFEPLSTWHTSAMAQRSDPVQRAASSTS